MASMQSTSTWIKIALLLFLLGTLLFIIGFSTRVWKTSHNFEPGLWRYFACRFRSGGCGTADWSSPAGKLVAAQAFACLALIAFIVSLVLQILFCFIDSCRRRVIVLAALILALVGILCCVICVGIYSTFYSGLAFGWSQGLFVAGFIINFIAVVFLFLEWLGKKV